MKTILKLLYGRLLKRLGLIYADIDDLPIFNYARAVNGHLEFLLRAKWIPKDDVYLSIVLDSFSEQFEELDLTNIELRVKAAFSSFKYLKTGDKKWKMDANHRLVELTKRLEGGSNTFNLSEFLIYIELTFGSSVGSLDPRKLSTRQAFFLYRRALNTNEKRRNDGTN